MIAVAVTAGVLAFGGGQGPSSAHVMTVMSPVGTSAAVPTFAVRCRGTSNPLVVMAARGKPGTRVPFVAYANNQIGARGAVTASPAGDFIVSVPVKNNARNGVRLQLMTHTALVGTITPTCTAPPPYAVAAPPAALTRGIKTAFSLNHNRNGSVTRWNPCDGAIHVLINAGRAGAGGVADARAALAALGQQTGLSFVYDGATTFVPTTTNAGSQPARLVIAWAPPGAGAGQSNYYSSGAVGEGGWRSSGTSSNGGATWNWKIVQGFVVVDPNVSMAGGFGNGVTRGALLLHELGHVVGLGHSGDSAQAMYPVLSSKTFGSYGAGDAAGLTAVGATQGCTTAS